MISITPTLAAAAIAESRRPVMGVTVERVDPEFTIIAGLAVPYSVHRFAAGNSFFFATAYDVAACTNIYYKKMTNIDVAADWNAGWSTLVAALGADVAYLHDLYVSGTNVFVCYVKSTGIAYFRESTDSGATFSVEAALSTHSAANDIVGCAVLDEDTVYFVTTGDVLFRSTRSGGAWADSPDWDYTDFWTFVAAGTKDKQNQMHARLMANGDHLIMFNAKKGSTATFTSATLIAVAYYRNGFGWVKPALGHQTIDFDYWHMLHGLSAAVNGFHFAGIMERYIEKADGTMVTPDEAYELQIGRSVDLLGWHLIPTGIYVSVAGNYAEDVPECYIAGIAVDGNYVCLVLSRTDEESNVYLCPASSWWGEAAVETTVPVLEDLSISHAVESASQIELKLSNKSGTYTDSATVKPGSIVRVSGGYITINGAETQQRFVGPIINRGRTTGADKVASFTVMDMLYRATAIKQGWPHILKGQNIFHADLADPLEVDLFVAQNGGWRESGGWYEQYERLVNAISLCGYDPGSAHFVRAKVRMVSNFTAGKIGLVVHHSVLESGVHTAYLAIYDKALNQFQIAKLDTDDMTTFTVIANAAGGGWSADTSYWLMARIMYGRIDMWYSTDGINYTLAVSANATSAEIGPHGYPGLYAYIGTDSDTILARFDDIEVFSAEAPMTGSDVMDYLSQVSGIVADEEKELDDSFPGSFFSSRWGSETGNWSVFGGSAIGYGTGVIPAAKVCDITTSDIIVRCILKVTAYETGLVVRSDAGVTNCYAAAVSTTSASILKMAGGAWSTLCSIPGTYSGDAVDVAFVSRGPYLSLYVSGKLACMAYDTSYDDGYCGLYSNGVIGTPSNHKSFEVQGFYKPVDVVTIRPGDTPGSVMAQLALMYPSGHFFCSHDGKLKWGVFDDLTIDLDVSDMVVEMPISERQEAVFTVIRSVGANSFGEVRDRSWGTALLGHRYNNIQVNAAPTGGICYELAADELDKSKRIREESITVRGNPAIELCDVIGTAEEDGGVAQARQVLSFSETLGEIYDQSFDGLTTVAGEAP